MKLDLYREAGATSTFGKLNVDGVYQCETLEDRVRAVKVPGDTAIPAGIYRVAITYSAHFGRNLPLLVDVPGFDGVRIHSGNTTADTEGCVLVGQARQGQDLLYSRMAFAELYTKLIVARSRNETLSMEIHSA